MRGGGVGFFDSTGKAQPSNGNKTEDGINELVDFADGSELNRQVSAGPEGFRTVSVSMCSHDVYAGANSTDPNNPNLTPEGAPRTTNGLLAAKAAIQYTQDRYRAGRSPTEVFIDEKRRQEAVLTVPDVRRIIRAEWRDLLHPELLVPRLRAPGLPCALRPGSSDRLVVG